MRVRALGAHVSPLPPRGRAPYRRGLQARCAGWLARDAVPPGYGTQVRREKNMLPLRVGRCRSACDRVHVIFLHVIAYFKLQINQLQWNIPAAQN